MKFKLIVDENKEEEIVATVLSPSDLTDRIRELILAHNGQDTIYGYDEEEWRQLPIQEIACITVLDGKVYAVHSSGQRYRLRQRLYELEAMLPDYFIRINKSALANEKQLERFQAGYSGAVDAVFRCGYREYVSRRCFAQIKRRFDVK